jgi:hypothetical protein
MKMKEKIEKLQQIVTTQNQIIQGYQELIILQGELDGDVEE